ncbi:MAG: tetratricopeptide repeat protein [Planctomycetota bacterium]
MDFSNTFTICFLVAVSCLFPNSVFSQQVGDRVVVTANFKTKLESREVGEVLEGDIRTVRAVNGKWCYLNNVEGWLPIRNVMNLQMAMKHFSKRIKDNERDAVAFGIRGTIYYELEQFPAAEKDLQASLALNNKNYNVWLLRGMVRKAKADRLRGIGKTEVAKIEYTNAANDFKVSINLNEENANAHFNIGLVFYALEDFEQAVKAYDRAIELDDSKALWFVSRGSAHLGLDQRKKAKEDYIEAIRLDKRLADAYIGLSNIYLIEEDLEKAFKYADAAVEEQSNNAMALNSRGWILFKQEKYEEAIFDLSRAIRFAPKLSIAYGNRGVCYVAINDFENAIVDHTAHLKLTPNNPFALSNRAVAWFGKGEYKKAVADYQAAEELAPNLDEALNGYAWFLATCPEEKYRDGELALEKAKAACKISEYKDWYQLDTLATAYAENDDFEQALKWAKKALEVAPKRKQDLCEEQIARFKKGEKLRSKVGKNAEQVIGNS